MSSDVRITELGPLPSDWRVDELGALNPFVTSGSRGWARYYKDTGAPFIRITNLSRGSIYLDLSDLKFVVVPLNDKEGTRTALVAGDLLVSITADIGIIGFVDAHLPTPAYINQHIALVRCDPGEVNTKFLAYFLAGERPQRAFRGATDQGAKAGMNLGGVRRILAAIPPRPEQDAIAEALSDIDAVLSGLDRLIAKKRDLKQAAMQQLLTGQTRLPGFRGEWQTKRLGDLGAFLKGAGVKKDEAQSGDLPCVRYGEIYTHHHDCIRSFNSWISRDVARGATRLRAGDLLFAGSGETKAEIGKCVAFVNECEAYAGGDIVILRPSGIDSLFMGYYCNTRPINVQKASKGQGDAVVHISAAALGSLSVSVPERAEQAAIAAVLSDIDAELTALQVRRDKTRDLKQAMLQELLTGRIRLPVATD